MKYYLMSLIISLLINISYNDAFAQNKAKNDINKQIIENKARIDTLEMKIKIIKEEAKKEREEYSERLQIKNDNLDFQKTHVGWWLNILGIIVAVLGIFVAIFGIGIPLLGLIYGKRMFDDIEKQKNNTRKDFELFKAEINERLKTLDKEIENKLTQADSGVKVIQISSEKIKVLMDEISQKVLKNDNTNEEKLDLERKTQLIIENPSINKYGKDFANAINDVLKEDYNNAITKLNGLINEYLGNINKNDQIRIYNIISYSYAKIKNYNKSIEYSLKVLNINSDDITALTNIGGSYLNKNENLKAEKYLQEAIKLKPDKVEALMNMGTVSLRKNLYKEAIEYYEKALIYNPKMIGLYNSIIETHIISNNIPSALDYYQKTKDILKSYDFVFTYIETILNIINNKNMESISTIVEKIKSDYSNDIYSTTWSFIDMKNWLSSSNSKDLSDDQRSQITELIKNLETWIQSTKKDETNPHAN